MLTLNKSHHFFFFTSAGFHDQTNNYSYGGEGKEAIISADMIKLLKTKHCS